MSQPISLKEVERKVFLATTNDGLWDIFLGSYFIMFAIVPSLSTNLGDFWSSLMMLPVCGVVYLMIRWLRKTVVVPRVGEVRFGVARKTKLARFSVIMLVVNLLALTLGVVAVWNFLRIPGLIIPSVFGLLLLLVFSFAAYILDFRRFYFYGLLLGFSPLVGEWLYAYRGAAHHGIPITFGTTAVLMVLVGLTLFLRFLRDYPAVNEEVPMERF